MIDLTPLDVRKKRGDFSNKLRGYDPQEVDIFLEEVAARLEELVKDNLRLGDRTEMLQERVDVSDGREKAVQEALVTAQELRADVKEQASREADLIEREARSRIDALVVEVERHVKERMGAVDELERQRNKFLRTFRTLLEREMDSVEVEEGRAPLEDVTVDLDLGGVWAAARESVVAGDSLAVEPDLEDADSLDDEADEVHVEEDAAAGEDEVASVDAAPDPKALWLYDLDESDEERG